MSRPDVYAVHDPDTFTISYVVADPASRAAAIIDPVLDFDAASGRTRTSSAEALLRLVDEQNLRVTQIFETHVHADHLSAAPFLRERTGAPIAIGAHVNAVRGHFASIFNLECAADEFDRLLADGEALRVGEIEGIALHTPGHTPACMVYVLGDAAFVGDTLFMPDYGTARCDFPGGDARALFRSIQRIFALPPETRLFMCHDYKAPGRNEFAWETTVAAQRADNKHVHDGVSEDEFVEMRSTRDATLSMPRLMLPSVQVNMRAGLTPAAESNGVRYLKLPLDVL